MRKIIKIQFNRAIKGDPVASSERNAEVSASPKAKHASRIIVTVLIIVVGIGTGWLGGRVLNNKMSPSLADAPSSDAPEEDVLTTESPDSPPSQPPTKDRPAVAAAPSQPRPEAEQPVVAPEPRLLLERELRAMERELREVPPKPQKVEKDAEKSETPAEDPAKETGRQTFWKKLQELPRNRRGVANKNANEDQHK